MENREFIEQYMHKKMKEVLSAESAYFSENTESNRLLYSSRIKEYSQCQIMYRLFYDEDYEPEKQTLFEED